MKVINKLLIILIGLIIITFLVFKLFEKDKNIEGMGVPTLFGAPKFAMQTTEVVTDAITNAVEVGRDAVKATVDTAADVADAGRDMALAGQESVRDTTMAAVEEGTDNIRAGIDESTKLGYSIKDTIGKLTIDLKNGIIAGMKLAWEIKYLTMFAGIFLLLGGYFVKVFLWLFAIPKNKNDKKGFIYCLFIMFGNFSSCFFYFFLDIVGYVLYLPFAFMFYLFRSSIEIYYPDCKREDYPPIYNVEKEIWDLIYDIDCKIYDATGFHVFHYSEEVMKRCYGCSPGKFPPFPNLFSPQGWTKALKEYNILTTITGIKF
jgi:hypothetical protein